MKSVWQGEGESVGVERKERMDHNISNKNLKMRKKSLSSGTECMYKLNGSSE